MKSAAPLLLRAREGWHKCDRRERVLLAVMTVMIAAFVFWYGLYVPLRHVRDAAQAQRLLAAAGLDAAHAQAATLQALPPATPASTDPAALRKAVLDSARQAGFGITRQRDNDQGDLEIEADAAAPGQLFAWLDQLRAQHGLAPDTLSAARSGRQLRVQAAFRVPVD